MQRILPTIKVLDSDSIKTTKDKLAKNLAELKTELPVWECDGLSEEDKKDCNKKIESIIKIINSEFENWKPVAEKLMTGTNTSPTRKDALNNFFNEVRSKKKNKDNNKEFHVNYSKVQPKIKLVQPKIKSELINDKDPSLAVMKNYLEYKVDFLDSAIKLTQFISQCQIMLDDIALSDRDKVPALINNLEKLVNDFNSENVKKINFNKHLSLHKMEKISSKEDHKIIILEQQMEKLEQLTKPDARIERAKKIEKEKAEQFEKKRKEFELEQMKRLEKASETKKDQLMSPTTSTTTTANPSITSTTPVITTTTSTTTKRKKRADEQPKNMEAKTPRMHLNPTLFAENKSQASDINTRTQSSNKRSTNLNLTKLTSSLADSSEKPRRNLPSRSKSSQHLTPGSNSPRRRTQKTVSVQPSPRGSASARNAPPTTGLFSPRKSKTSGRETNKKLSQEKTMHTHRKNNK